MPAGRMAALASPTRSGVVRRRPKVSHRKGGCSFTAGIPMSNNGGARSTASNSCPMLTEKR
jgi:hypothetical protein